MLSIQLSIQQDILFNKKERLITGGIIVNIRRKICSIFKVTLVLTWF